MSIDRLSQLKSLRLYGMATAWSELLAEGPRLPMQPEAWLDRLIDAEQTDRQVRSLRYLRLPLKSGVLSFVQNVDKELRNGGKASTCGIHAGI